MVTRPPARYKQKRLRQGSLIRMSIQLRQPPLVLIVGIKPTFKAL